MNGLQIQKGVVADKKKEIEELSYAVLDSVIDNIGNSTITVNLMRKEIIEHIHEAMATLLAEKSKHLSHADKQKITGIVVDEILGYGPITKLIEDSTVTEIMVNGYNSIYVEREGKIVKDEVTFRNDGHVLHIIDKIITPLGRRVDESSPMVDARLPDGSRVNVIISPLSVKGPVITIRKFATDPFTLEDLISFGSLTREMAIFLKACVRAKANIVVSGGTGSGKTTFLNVLSSFIPSNERIVTIEDAAELQLKQEHVVTLESRPANIEGRGMVSIRDLVVNSLRMRPDRIVVGEVRGKEALDMLQAMNTGHDGSITTLHANNTREALSRIETMVLMAGMDLPLKAIREQASSAIDLIIQNTRYSDGSRKVSQIAEVVGMEGDTITMQDIFDFKSEGFDEKGRLKGKHVATGIVPKLLNKLKEHGESASTDIFKTTETVVSKWGSLK